MSDRTDVIVVGGGHNGLACAAYLARAGLSVRVLERRPRVGGAVVTEEVVPGYRFDLGASVLILLNYTSLEADLELERFGLRCLSLDPMFFSPFPDGGHLFVWRDVDRTCQSIAAFSPPDADAYRRFVERWRPVAEGMLALLLEAPSVGGLARAFWPASLAAARRLPWSAHRLLDESFTHPGLKSSIALMAAQAGAPLDEPFSAAHAAFFASYHLCGIRRPIGGAGALSEALAAAVRAHGGVVHLDSPALRIGLAGGRAAFVETRDQRYEAGCVVSAAHIQATLDLLGEAAPARMRRRIGALKTGNGLGMAVRCAVDALPSYSALPGTGPQHTALQLIAPDLATLPKALADFRARRLPAEPMITAMTFSAVDGTLAPPGKHTLFLWAQAHPYELADGRSWDDAGEEAADVLLARLARFAPGVEKTVRARLVQTPRWFERVLALPRANIVHLDLSPGQMLWSRPGLGPSPWSTTIPGLYLTGASTHPGGGVLGTPGRLAAERVLAELGGKAGTAALNIQ